MPEPVSTTARTARHDLPYLFAGQTQKEAFVNEALARLDALVQPAVLGTAAAPPADPRAGDCYIVAADPQGDWAGRADAIASWAGNQWLFAAPMPGSHAFDRSHGGYAIFDTVAGWQRPAAPAMPTAGETQDREARAALAQLVAALRVFGLFP